jgi:uncharacterized protein (DUF427 family)
MTLTVGLGPLGPRPAAKFNLELPALEGLLFLDPFHRRIRGLAGGETIVDSRHVQMLHEHGRLPIFLFPIEDLRRDLLEPSERTGSSENKGEERWSHLRVGDELRRDAVFEYVNPPEQAEALRGLAGVVWDAMDEWLEEDEQAIVHPRDPYHRVDVLDTSRHVRVSLDGEVLAETDRARVLFETSLPPRWYIPREDVREGVLTEGEQRSACAYKGFAPHYSVRVGERTEPDLAWTYPEPRREVERIKDYVAFYNERVDLEIDGERQERPMTPWHPDWRGPKPEDR